MKDSDVSDLVRALNRNSEIVALVAGFEGAPRRECDCGRVATKIATFGAMYRCDQCAALLPEFQWADVRCAARARRLEKLLSGE
jgi:hypothetical protein